MAGLIYWDRFQIQTIKYIIVKLYYSRTATEMDGTLHTDFRKSETSRDIKKKILISFEYV